MAQVARGLKRFFLQALPVGTRRRVLQAHPNLRKAAPSGLKLQFNEYLDEFSVNIDTRFKVERIMWTGRYEPDLLALLERWVTAKCVCFDIGANVGALTLAMAQRVRGGSGQVHAFEPAPGNYARLLKNIALNPSVRSQIHPVNRGVGAEPGTLFWQEEKGNEGNGGLLGTSGVSVSVTTLDQYCQEHDIDRLDFVKIDVESMEYEVLCGAAGTLRRCRPRLYFETMGRSAGLRDPDIFRRLEKFLVDLDYDLFRLNRQKELVPTRAEDFGDYTIGIPRS